MLNSLDRPAQGRVAVMPRDEISRLLNGAPAQALLQSSIPVRFAYTALDGSPRVVPLAFHWDGERFVICTLPGSPKVRVVKANPHVAMKIDTQAFPPHILLVRGTATVQVVDGVPAEYLAASTKQVGAEGMATFEAQVRAMYDQMVRIDVEPTWAKLIDFETTLPSAVERLPAGTNRTIRRNSRRCGQYGSAAAAAC